MDSRGLSPMRVKLPSAKGGRGGGPLDPWGGKIGGCRQESDPAKGPQRNVPGRSKKKPIIPFCSRNV